MHLFPYSIFDKKLFRSQFISTLKITFLSLRFKVHLHHKNFVWNKNFRRCFKNHRTRIICHLFCIFRVGSIQCRQIASLANAQMLNGSHAYSGRVLIVTGKLCKLSWIYRIVQNSARYIKSQNHRRKHLAVFRHHSQYSPLLDGF